MLSHWVATDKAWLGAAQGNRHVYTFLPTILKRYCKDISRYYKILRDIARYSEILAKMLGDIEGIQEILGEISNMAECG